MKHKRTKSLLPITAVTALVLAAGPAAQAIPTLSLNDGINPIVLVSDIDGDGVVTINQAVGNFFVNVTTGLTYPALPGSASNPHMDLNSVDVSSNGGGTLTILWDDDRINIAGPLGMLALFGGTTIGTWQYNTMYSTDGGTTFSPLTSQTGTSGAFSGTAGALLNATGPVVLRQELIITHLGAGVSSGDNELRVPEGGATLSLFGIAMLGLGVFRKKFSKKS